MAHTPTQPTRVLLPLGDAIVVFGRASECDVVPMDQGVSRKHCFISRDPGDGQYYVHDTSSNGTLVLPRGTHAYGRVPKRGARIVKAGDKLMLRRPSADTESFVLVAHEDAVTPPGKRARPWRSPADSEYLLVV